MSEAKKMMQSVNINHLPPEMVVEILKFLNFKEISHARMICTRWKEIIDKGNLLKNATGTSLSHLYFIQLYISNPGCFFDYEINYYFDF